jgi:hypothetical protein
MTFVVEAYLSGSDRLLWRSKESDEGVAYDLALTADTDPRIEILLLEVADGDQGSEPVVVLDGRK